MRKKQLVACLLAGCLVWCVADEAPKPFIMPVKATAFEIRNRELLSMGENALASRDFVGAVNYFYELREKLSAAPASGDWFLSSALLAEACLGFQTAQDLELGLPNKGRINTLSLAQSILAQKLPETVSPSLRVYWQFLLARLQQTQGRIDDCLQTLRGLWGEANGRRERLADLHNWVLLTYMQVLASKAETLSDEQADELWSQIVALSAERVTEVKDAVAKEEEDARKAVSVQAGETLSRLPRQDALEVEFVRLKACALLETEHYDEALNELKRDCMAVYAAERNWLLAACLANLSRLAEAEAQYDKCERDFAPAKDSGALLAVEIRKAQWAMFNMYYKAGRFKDAEAFLEKLQPGLKDNRKFDWLVLRMNVLKGRLNQLAESPADVPKAELAAEIDAIYNCALRYSFLFPDMCQANWKAVIEGFTKEQRSEYCQVHVIVLYVLGQAEARIGNVNVAMELFDRICHSEEVDDSMRYESCVALGDIAASDIKRSIEAFKLCETLKGISRDQKANALFKAAVRALKEARRETASKEVREAMGAEAVVMLKQLCFEYTDTAMGLEASLQLADFYYENHTLKDALAFYERYFMSDKCDIVRRDYARLRWGRCWRLLAESADTAKPTPENLQKAFYMLQLLRDGEATDSDVRSQATLEAYRVALAMGKEDVGQKLLDEVIDGKQDSEAASEVVWVALYERMLGNYQKRRLDEAVRDGELFLRFRGDRQDMTPWVREFFVLYGDVQAARRQWAAASQQYLRLELLGKKEPMDSMMQYAMYEAASCLFQNGEPAAADDVIRRHFEGKSGLETHFLYESAMLQGKCRQAQGDFEGARQCFERAQTVFGQSDTYKSSLAKCRQGEMLLMEAEAELNKTKGADRSNAMKQLARASEIFYNLLEPKDGVGAASTSGKDHCFDLYLRAQFELGECYENLAEGENEAKEAKESALWCYRRIGDYFVAKFREGNRVQSSRYYVRSIERRVSLLMGGIEQPSYDVLDTVARLYEEYARMALPGSVMAARRAEELRKRMK